MSKVHSIHSTIKTETGLELLQEVFNQVAEERLAESGEDGLGETATHSLLNELGQEFFRQRLQRAADEEAEEILVDGRRFRRHAPGKVAYHSLCGGLEVTRHSYRQVGVRNGPTVIPLEIRFGLQRQTTPQMARCIVSGRAKLPSRHLEEQLVEAHREPPSRSTLERVGRDLAWELEQIQPSIEPVIRAQERLPDGACGISIGMDRTGLPLEKKRTKYEPPNTRRKNAGEPRKRKVNVRYEMPYVATITIVDSEGWALDGKRYEAMSKEGAEAVVQPLMADLRHFLRQDSSLQVGIVQDGAPDLWDALRRALKKEKLVNQWHEAIDWYHMVERLAQALKPLPVKNWLTDFHRWMQRLQTEDFAAEKLLDFLDSNSRSLRGRSRHEVRKHYNYFKERTDLMRYAQLTAKGLPIGSGATEGACKSLVWARTKRSGQRWSHSGASGVLSIRAMYQSNRLSAFMDHFEISQKADIRAA